MFLISSSYFHISGIVVFFSCSSSSEDENIHLMFCHEMFVNCFLFPFSFIFIFLIPWNFHFPSRHTLCIYEMETTFTFWISKWAFLLLPRRPMLSSFYIFTKYTNFSLCKSLYIRKKKTSGHKWKIKIVRNGVQHFFQFSFNFSLGSYSTSSSPPLRRFFSHASTRIFKHPEQWDYYNFFYFLTQFKKSHEISKLWMEDEMKSSEICTW